MDYYKRSISHPSEQHGGASCSFLTRRTLSLSKVTQNTRSLHDYSKNPDKRTRASHPRNSSLGALLAHNWKNSRKDNKSHSFVPFPPQDFVLWHPWGVPKDSDHAQITLFHHGIMAESKRRLPATEALEKSIRKQRALERASKRRRTSAFGQNDSDRNGSFEMACIIHLSEPGDEYPPFPRIEWTFDDDDDNKSDYNQVHDIPPLPSDHERDLLRSSSHSSHTQRDSRNPLTRSKAFETSLCYLAERSVTCRHLVIDEKVKTATRRRAQKGSNTQWSRSRSKTFKTTRIYERFLRWLNRLKYFGR